MVQFSNSVDLQVLEERIGHTFRNRDLLIRALTHKSLASERKPEGPLFADNEQMEFLGDAILGFVVSECLVHRFPHYPEGRLSKLKAHIVSAVRLHEVAQSLDLGVFLHLGRGEEMSGGRGKRTLLADALEAIIAAVYLDGGVDTARRFIIDHMVGNGNDEAVGLFPVVDYKSTLQERVQALRLPQPRYVVVEETGPEHAKTFVVEVRIGTQYASRGEGSSKKSAGQSAAKSVLQQLDSPV